MHSGQPLTGGETVFYGKKILQFINFQSINVLGLFFIIDTSLIVLTVNADNSSYFGIYGQNE